MIDENVTRYTNFKENDSTYHFYAYWKIIFAHSRHLLNLSIIPNESESEYDSEYESGV